MADHEGEHVATASPTDVDQPERFPAARRRHLEVPGSRWGVTRPQFIEFMKLVSKAHKNDLLQNPKGTAFRYSKRKFKDKKMGPNMHHINAQVIQPFTAGKWPLKAKLLTGYWWGSVAHKDATMGTSWALAKNPSGIEIQLFVSHAWNEGVFEFGRNLLEAWPEEFESAYICFLANPQNLDLSEVLGTDPLLSPFAQTLMSRSMKQMVMLSTQNEPIHERLWCVLEAFVALENGLPVEIGGEPKYLSNLKTRIQNHEKTMLQSAEEQTAQLEKRLREIKSETEARRLELFQTHYLPIPALVVVTLAMLSATFWFYGLWFGIYSVLTAYVIVIPLAYWEYEETMRCSPNFLVRQAPATSARLKVLFQVVVVPLAVELLRAAIERGVKKIKTYQIDRLAQQQLDVEQQGAEEAKQAQREQLEEQKRLLGKTGEVDVLQAKASNQGDRERILEKVKDRAHEINQMITQMITKAEVSKLTATA